MRSTYVLKVMQKNSHPPVWMNLAVPSGITFSTLSVILNTAFAVPIDTRFEVEFFQEGVRLWENRDGEPRAAAYNFDFQEASSTYIDDYLGKTPGMPVWFSYYTQSGALRLRVELSQVKEQELEHPVCLKYSKGYAQFVTEKAVPQIESQLAALVVRYEQRARFAKQVDICRELQKKNGCLHGMEKPKSAPGNLKKCMKHQVRELVSESDYSELDNILARYYPLDEDGKPDMSYELDADARDAVAEEIVRYAAENVDAMKKELKRRNPKPAITRPTRYPLGKVLNIVYSKDDLILMAKDNGLRRNQGYKKAELAERIANTLLSKSEMQERLGQLSDETMRVFEKACACKDTVFVPQGWIENRAAERLVDQDYLFWLNDEVSAEVPPDVMEAYDKINTEEFRKARSERAWISTCVQLIPILYGSIPADEFYRLYRQGGRKSKEELLAYLQDHSDWFPQAVLVGEKLITAEMMKNDLYLEFEAAQADKPFYIPRRSEAEEIVNHGYPDSLPECCKLRLFLQDRMEIDEIEAHTETSRIWNKLNMDESANDILHDLAEDITFSSEEDLYSLANLVFNLNNNTRMLLNRGWKPNELRKVMGNPLDLRNMTIVPGSSMAAEMLEQGRKELEDMGLKIDLDSNAAVIPTASVSADHKTINMKTRKIYPNDPCPCGSGKKYKHCCGRKA